MKNIDKNRISIDKKEFVNMVEKLKEIVQNNCVHKNDYYFKHHGCVLFNFNNNNNNLQMIYNDTKNHDHVFNIKTTSITPELDIKTDGIVKLNKINYLLQLDMWIKDCGDTIWIEYQIPDMLRIYNDFFGNRVQCLRVNDEDTFKRG